MLDCVFCKIVNKELPASLVYEDDDCIAINDIKPISPVHILIISKKHIISVNHLKEEDKNLVGAIFLVAKKIAKEKSISKEGYRVAFNVGRDAGQTVDHLHLHLTGGKKLALNG